MNLVLRGRKNRTLRKIYIKIDITKAFDNVGRKKLFEFLEARAKTDLGRKILNLIKSLYSD